MAQYPYTPPARQSIKYKAMNEWMARDNREYSRIVNVPYYSSWESLTGYKGPKTFGQYEVRPCLHRKLTVASFAPIQQRDERYDFFEGEGTTWHVFPEASSMDAMVPQILTTKLMVLDEDEYENPDIDSLVDGVIDNLFQPPDLLTFVAEGVRELPELLLNSWRSLGYLNLPSQVSNAAVFRQFRQMRDPRHAADMLSEQVLSTNLGYLPLVSDITSISDLLYSGAQQYVRAQWAIENSDGLRIVSNQNGTINRTFGDSLGIGSYQTFGTNRRVYGCRVYADFPEGNNTWTREAQAAVGLNWDLRTIWNLTPFSFLVDYIIPIGDALRGARLFANLRVLDGTSWVSDKGECEFFGTIGASAEIEPGVRSFPGVHNGYFRFFNRRAYTWDVPDQISVRNDGLFQMSGREWANSLSLAWVLRLRQMASDAIWSHHL